MADEPKPDASDPGQPNISPSPQEAAGDKPAEAKPADGAAPPPAGGPALPPADALSDGTKPTILTPGETHHSVKKSKTSLTTIYRRADVLTTLFTFAGAVVAAVLILGGYAYFTRSKTAQPTSTPKVTNLDKAELDKLDNFFSGNSAGSSAQVLTISSSSLFNNRVAIASDLKVVGGVQVSGTTALGDLTVDKTSTLGVTNVRGSLSVTGPLNVQSPTILGSGATVNGNLSVTGNGSFGGSLSAKSLAVADLNVGGTLTLAGHLSMSGQTPSVSPGSEAGGGATASIEGTDASGTVTINTGNVPNNINNPGGLLVNINFRNAYPRAPHIVITPVGQTSASVQPYIIKNAASFTIGSVLTAPSNKTYVFDYWVTQ